MKPINTLSLRRAFGIGAVIPDNLVWNRVKVRDQVDILRVDELGAVLVPVNLKPTVPVLLTLSPNLYSVGATHAVVIDGDAPIRIFVPAANMDSIDISECYIEGYII